MTAASRPASESETTALSVQPDEAKTAPAEGDYKIADIGENGLVYVKFPDGRHFGAKLGDGVEVRRGTKVKVSGGESDLTVTGLAS